MFLKFPVSQIIKTNLASKNTNILLEANEKNVLKGSQTIVKMVNINLIKKLETNRKNYSGNLCIKEWKEKKHFRTLLLVSLIFSCLK